MLKQGIVPLQYSTFLFMIDIPDQRSVILLPQKAQNSTEKICVHSVPSVAIIFSPTLNEIFNVKFGDNLNFIFFVYYLSFPTYLHSTNIDSNNAFTKALVNK